MCLGSLRAPPLVFGRGICSRSSHLCAPRFRPHSGPGRPSRRAQGRSPRQVFATSAVSLVVEIEEVSVSAKGLFGDDTKAGETDTQPAAFDNKADLFAKFDKTAADAKAAAGAIKDEASFKAEWPKVVSNCGGCHKAYRKPKQ